MKRLMTETADLFLGVLDPRTDTEISLDRAISLGIINQQNGSYVNPLTGLSIPIPEAMNDGKIKVRSMRSYSFNNLADIGFEPVQIRIAPTYIKTLFSTLNNELWVEDCLVVSTNSVPFHSSQWSGRFSIMKVW